MLFKNLFTRKVKKDEIEVSPHNNMLRYKKGYTAAFVKDMIDKHKLSGLSIFDHLDGLDSIDFLKDYGFLVKLNISCIYDHDYSFLKNLTNLDHLLIGLSVERSNLIDLSNQKNLESLNLHWRKGKIVGLEKCSKIKSLILWSFKEKDFSAISQLTELANLEVKTGSIETTNGLQNLNHLKSLSFGNCPRLKSIKDISCLNNLSVFEIDACSKIEDYDELKGLDSLTSLNMVNCKGIKSIDFIKNFSSLKQLHLLGNTNVLDGDLKPALGVEKVIYSPHRHYNIKIENKEHEALVKSNLEKILKGLFN